MPATVKDTETDGHAGVRIDFGPREVRLEEISWEEFFNKFDEAQLAFVYQDKTKDGKISRFTNSSRANEADLDVRDSP